MKHVSEATVHAPATIGNCGPGFDALSLALHDAGDVVTLRHSDADTLEVTGPGAGDIPTLWAQNVVGPTLDALRARTGANAPLAVRIEKARPGGSGLGSSASSAGGAALAFHRLYPPEDLTEHDLWEAAYAGERLAGGGNPDDVAAVVLGGLAILRRAGESLAITRVAPPHRLRVGVAVPALALETTKMREVLPESWPRAAVVANLGNTAAIVDACHRGDAAAMGACLDDRLALPARKRFVPFFDKARSAALAAGAHGVCLAGSGPAIAAFCSDDKAASSAAAAMAEAVMEFGIAAEHFVTRPEMEVMHAAALR
jgi:homoserine kinase